MCCDCVTTDRLTDRRGHGTGQVGCGKSTSYYPLLVSSLSVAIDNYPEWCNKVSAAQVVACLVQARRLHLHCVEATRSDGSVIPLSNAGNPVPWANATDKGILEQSYLDSVGPAFGIDK